jgi:nucleotide-binding universal stress UspA family protein
LPNGDYATNIIEQAYKIQADTILMGGYKAAPLVEIFVGSVVDQVLRDTSIPVLICR